jgi:hypothetical protein
VDYSNDGDIRIYKDTEFTRGYYGRFYKTTVHVSSIEIETTYLKDKVDNFDYLNSTPTIRTVDTIKGKAIIPPLYDIESWDNKIVEEVDISFDVTVDLLNKVKEYTEEVKKEFKTDNMFDYKFEMEDLVGYSFLKVKGLGSYIRVILDLDIYDTLIKRLKENTITDVSLEIVYYSLFTKTNLEYNEKNYGYIIDGSIITRQNSFGVVTEITFKEYNKITEVGKQALLDKNKVELETKIDKLSTSYAKTLDRIRFNVKTGFIVLGIMIFISLFF